MNTITITEPTRVTFTGDSEAFILTPDGQFHPEGYGVDHDGREITFPDATLFPEVTMRLTWAYETGAETH